MDIKELAIPLVGSMIQQNASSAALAKKITELLEEASFSQMQESIEKLKFLMSCYRCEIGRAHV